MKSISVFCGSSVSNVPKFLKVAQQLGKTLAEEKIKLIFGGSNVGLMGAVANACLQNGGSVVGIIPRFLQCKETPHLGLTELIVCESMHERKTKMFELSEGFIALPGGFGTLEEVVEILTWRQIGLHSYPIGLLNVNGFYNSLRTFFDEMVRTELLKTESKDMAMFADTIPELFTMMRSHKAPEAPKWVTTDEVWTSQ